MRGEDDRGRGLLPVAHQRFGFGPAHLGDDGVFLQELGEGARHPPLVLVHHGQAHAERLVAADDRGDDRDRQKRPDEQDDQRAPIAAEETQVLQEEGEHGPTPRGLPGQDGQKDAGRRYLNRAAPCP